MCGMWDCLKKGAGMRDQLSPTSLRESSQGLSGGGTGKGRTACKFELHLQFPGGSPPTELSDFRQSARSKNERECKQTLKKKVPRVMMSLLMSYPPISILRRLFRCGYSNSRDVVARSPSFSRPAARAPRRACSQATYPPSRPWVHNASRISSLFCSYLNTLRTCRSLFIVFLKTNFKQTSFLPGHKYRRKESAFWLLQEYTGFVSRRYLFLFVQLPPL